jgi:hypothetical protein
MKAAIALSIEHCNYSASINVYNYDTVANAQWTMPIDLRYNIYVERRSLYSSRSKLNHKHACGKHIRILSRYETESGCLGCFSSPEMAWLHMPFSRSLV